jgi:Carboxypeptidase regulatory-like domain
MRFFRMHASLLALSLAVGCYLALAPTTRPLIAQETTGGLQGTVKDPSGAVIPKATVTVTAPTLVGSKVTTTDTSGFYHFANLPPGTYTVKIEAAGFDTLQQAGLLIEVGHLPTVDLMLKIGATTNIIEVSASAPMIDVTSDTTHTNITEELVQDIPHGESFQSAIQFAPSARNEPLEGTSQFSIGNGNGATSPGSGSSGNAYGFSIAGGSDSENAYLVEGQETANLIGGYSHTNVPFDFIDQMVIDTTGIQAEHGGALGGVINVIMQKGTNTLHGSIWGMFNDDGLNGSPRANPRYDPNGGPTATTDTPWQQYQPKRYHTSDVFPGFRVGLPLIADRLFLFAAFSPEWSDEEHTVTYNHAFSSTYPTQTGKLSFGQNTQTYYTNLRADAALGTKIHIFGSLLDQGQRQTGETLPFGDDVHGLFDVSSSVNPIGFSHSLGYAAPNTTYNLGLDYSATPSIILTSRFGYFFENYHDFGYPTTGDIYSFFGNGVGGTDLSGNPLPADLQEPNGYFNQPNSQTYTLFDADKRTQFDQDVAVTRSGRFGTHQIKFGYQLNRSNNNIYQRWPAPEVEVFPGSTAAYSPAGSTGTMNCAALEKADDTDQCSGQYGYVIISDYGTQGQATSYNHAFYGQDAWTIGKGLTLSYGLRVEKENVPSENDAAGLPTNPITFGWNDKVAPRFGFAWDPWQNGKAKVFGGYGSFTDMMKLNVAIGSFGGQYWQNCAYALNDPVLTDVDPQFDANFRYCNATTANFGGATPSGLVFLESLNNRGTEGVVNGLKPYRQHESTIGIDYQINPTTTLEARWDRRRLDHVIEDAALFDSSGNEIFTIVNPGEGPNAFNATCQTAGVDPNTGDSYAACPPDVKPARSYDGLELRLTKTIGQHWSGMFSYTYSNFRGNYCGLTSCLESDGGGGRNAPNNSRAFDETYFQFDAYGKPFNGKLATDRPNAFKGYGYYDLNEGHDFTTTIGLLQDAYSGTPQSSFVDVGYSVAAGGNFGEFAVYPEGLGKWVDITQNPTTGVITVGNARTFRTPWFTQSDLNLKQTYKIKEAQSVSFDATISNALNQHEVVAYYGSVDTAYQPQFIAPGGIPFYFGGEAYSLYEHPYDWKGLLNTDGITLNSQYGKPYEFQVGRNIRLQVHYNF